MSVALNTEDKWPHTNGTRHHNNTQHVVDIFTVIIGIWCKHPANHLAQLQLEAGDEVAQNHPLNVCSEANWNVARQSLVA